VKRSIILLLFFVFVRGHCDTTRTLASISYRSLNGSTVALITLTDQSTWKWIPDLYSENLLRKWKEGDPIIVSVTNHPGFALQNTSQPHYMPIVALSFHSYLLYPYIVGYEDEVIELSDGTQWDLIYDFNKRTLCHWSFGDRIIPVQGSQNNFELINLDIPYENRCQIERFVEVIPYDPSFYENVEETQVSKAWEFTLFDQNS
jgi:hypothetical protein